jgi:hypothetical protein
MAMAETPSPAASSIAAARSFRFILVVGGASVAGLALRSLSLAGDDSGAKKTGGSGQYDNGREQCVERGGELPTVSTRLARRISDVCLLSMLVWLLLLVVLLPFRCFMHCLAHFNFSGDLRGSASHSTNDQFVSLLRPAS